MAPHAKVELVQLPTPLHRLNWASENLGVDLWIKRDDLTGFAMGGNKGRKLEYLMADAIASGAQVVVTCGAIQSNFIRQLGAACAVLGMRCAAAVMQAPYEHQPPLLDGLLSQGGNVLLDELVGVDLRRYGDDTWETLYRYAEDVAQSYEAKRFKVFRIPVGGSTPQGAFAFFEAGMELQGQSEDAFDSVVFASSSGSTQVGLAHCFRDSSTKVLGVCSDPEPEIIEDFAVLSGLLAPIIGQSPLSARDFDVRFDMVGPGYGNPSQEGKEAIEYLARTEGIFLDPVYTAKAFAGLLKMVREGELSGRICFWHTGGLPALFAA
jgi:D-cysteine desulfhydrase family pyridoxal phosphate-dependent enzyme